MSGAVSALLSLARGLCAGQVTPAEVADRLVILAHRVHIDAAQAKVPPIQGRVPVPPTTEDGE